MNIICVDSLYSHSQLLSLEMARHVIEAGRNLSPDQNIAVREREREREREGEREREKEREKERAGPLLLLPALLSKCHLYSIEFSDAKILDVLEIRE